jgi:hypothetical protein
MRSTTIHLEAAMAGKVEEAGVDGLWPEDDRTHAVVADPTGQAIEEGDGVLMAADQGRQRHRTHELCVEISRVVEYPSSSATFGVFDSEPTELIEIEATIPSAVSQPNKWQLPL